MGNCSSKKSSNDVADGKKKDLKLSDAKGKPAVPASKKMVPAGAAGKKAPAPAATKKTAAEPPTDQKTEAERLKERDKLIAARNQLEREELQRRNNNNNNNIVAAPKEEEEEKPLTPQVTEGDSQPPSTAHTKVNEQRLESSPKNEVTPEKTNPSPREASADVGRETSNARVVEVHPDDKNTNDVSASPVRDDEETKIFHKTPPPPPPVHNEDGEETMLDTPSEIKQRERLVSVPRTAMDVAEEAETPVVEDASVMVDATVEGSTVLAATKGPNEEEKKEEEPAAAPQEEEKKEEEAPAQGNMGDMKKPPIELSSATSASTNDEPAAAEEKGDISFTDTDEIEERASKVLRASEENAESEKEKDEAAKRHITTQLLVDEEEGKQVLEEYKESRKPVVPIEEVASRDGSVHESPKDEQVEEKKAPRRLAPPLPSPQTKEEDHDDGEEAQAEVHQDPMAGVEQPADEEEDAHSPERKLELSENEEKETREKMDISNVKNAFVKRNTWVEEGEKKEKEESEEKKEEDSTPPPTRPPPKVLSPPPPPQEEEAEEKAEEEEDEYFGNKPEEVKEL